MKVELFASASEAYNRAYELILDEISSCLMNGQHANIAVSGGKTPLPLFERMASGQKRRWEKVNIFWVDERWVPVGHPENNFSNAMLSGLSSLPATFFPVPTELATPQETADAYQSTLINILRDDFPCLDLVLLGAGTDGHTASIFDLSHLPNNRIAAVTIHPSSRQQRITLTMDVLINTRKIIILLLGEEKRLILQSLDRPQGGLTPVANVALRGKDVVVLSDII
jgi:6-phosphogluconolactonase